MRAENRKQPNSWVVAPHATRALINRKKEIFHDCIHYFFSLPSTPFAVLCAAIDHISSLVPVIDLLSTPLSAFVLHAPAYSLPLYHVPLLLLLASGILCVLLCILKRSLCCCVMFHHFFLFLPFASLASFFASLALRS